MTTFTPYEPLLGGALIGLAAVMLMAFQGKIAGISGIVFRLLPPYRDDGTRGRVAFVAGLVAAPVLAGLWSDTAQTVSAGPAVMIIAGALVGFGAVWGNGCTSGHGVCGVARLSHRSIVATLIFMAAGIVTVFMVRHVIGA